MCNTCRSRGHGGHSVLQEIDFMLSIICELLGIIEESLCRPWSP